MSHEITWLFVYGSPRVIIFTSEVIFMVFVGIDVAKDKHDLYAVDSDGVVLCDNFTFANSAAGFASFLKQVSPWGKIKVGIEATGITRPICCPSSKLTTSRLWSLTHFPFHGCALLRR